MLRKVSYYTTIYEYDPTRPQSEWKVYDVNQPAARNTLQELRFGYGYWIKVTMDVILRLKGATGNTNGIASFKETSSLSATYFGILDMERDFMPSAGMPIIARVNGSTCGRGQIAEYEGKLYYGVLVAATGQNLVDCGAQGRIVTFQIGSYVMRTTGVWNNDHPYELLLRR